jgi:hypothetical protein
MDTVAIYANAGVCAVIAVPIAVTGLLTCIKGRRCGDPARRGFTWLKLAYAFTFLYVPRLRS